MTHFPPEWHRHAAVWIGFPSDTALWLEDLSGAQQEVAAFARAVHADGAGEAVRLVCANDEAARIAAELAPDATIIRAPFFDVWLRDTGPIMVEDQGTLTGRDFRGNGWGGKYPSPLDDALAATLLAQARLPRTSCDWILEGGAIDVDGAGLLVTTEQCLLNPNRNPGMSRADIEARLASDLGIARVLWLGDGLAGDHTDGHVDNLARFVAPGTLALPVAASDDDPNAAVYADAWTRARAHGLVPVAIPSPGRIERDGEIVAASYMNFYIGNAAVVVPIHGVANDEAAVAAIAALFPGRRTIGLRTDHVLTGGGSFHCISQQVPAL